MAVAVDERMTMIEELIKDETKVKEIFSSSPTEAREKLAKEGIVLEDDEFSAIMLGMNGDEDNLTEDQLNAVVGGCKGCYDFWYKVGQAVDKVLTKLTGVLNVAKKKKKK